MEMENALKGLLKVALRQFGFTAVACAPNEAGEITLRLKYQASAPRQNRVGAPQ